MTLFREDRGNYENIIEKRIDDLIMYENNPKIHTDEQIDKIAKSIELTKGLRQPIVIDKNNVIVVGHGRVQAAMQLGLETVPCELADDLTEEEIRAYRLIDNELAKGESDLDLLEQELASFNDIDMSVFGFICDFDSETDLDLDDWIFVNAIVEKEYVKGRQNLVANPAITEYNKTATAANGTVATLINIIKTLTDEEKTKAELLKLEDVQLMSIKF